MQSATQDGAVSKTSLWAGRILTVLAVLLFVFGATFGLPVGLSGRNKCPEGKPNPAVGGPWEQRRGPWKRVPVVI